MNGKLVCIKGKLKGREFKVDKKKGVALALPGGKRVEIKYAKKDNNFEGSFINHILCIEENIILSHIRTWCDINELDIHSLFFDGLMVNGLYADTILPDIEESFGVKITDIKETLTIQEELDLKAKFNRGFVKSQHNLDIEYDVEATIQPVASLTKPEVREILKFFKMPEEIIYRKAFPGPALAARIIGPITAENLAFEKKVHDIVESKINEFYIKKHGKSMIINDKGEQEPFQMFAAISEDVLNKKVTGLVNGQRTYDFPLAVYGKWNYKSLVEIASKFTGYTRMFYEIVDCKKGVYDVVIRSVNSIDARTASVTDLPFDLISSISEKLSDIPETKRIYFDMTPKPPGTIEYV